MRDGSGGSRSVRFPLTEAPFCPPGGEVRPYLAELIFGVLDEPMLARPNHTVTRLTSTRSYWQGEATFVHPFLRSSHVCYTALAVRRCVAAGRLCFTTIAVSSRRVGAEPRQRARGIEATRGAGSPGGTDGQRFGGGAQCASRLSGNRAVMRSKWLDRFGTAGEIPSPYNQPEERTFPSSSVGRAGDC
jgi:hypothetical protein